MIRINIHEAKTHLSRYLERVEQGETIVVCRRNDRLIVSQAIVGGLTIVTPDETIARYPAPVIW